MKFKSKYKAIRSEKYGRKWSSKAELDYFETIKDVYETIEFQPKIYLSAAKILYVCDFLVYEEGRKIYLEVKGVELGTWRLKKKLYKAYCKDELRIIKRSGKKFKVTEIINEGGENAQRRTRDVSKQQTRRNSNRVK